MPAEAEALKDAAGAVGESVAGYIVQAIRNRASGAGAIINDSMNTGLLSEDSLSMAKEAAALQGEELGVFLARAIKDTAERDAILRKIPKPRKQEAKQEEAAPEPADYDFHAHAAENFEKWRQRNIG